jgi:hypothetical protein
MHILTNLIDSKINDHINLHFHMRFLLEGLGVLFKTVQLTNQKLSLSTFSLFTTTNIGQWSHQILPVAISYGYHPCPPPSSLLPPPLFFYLPRYIRVKILLQNVFCRTPAIAGWLDPISIFHSTVQSWLESTH